MRCCIVCHRYSLDCGDVRKERELDKVSFRMIQIEFEMTKFDVFG